MTQFAQESEGHEYGLSEETVGELNLSLEKGDKQELIEAMHALHPADIADYIENLSQVDRQHFLDLVKDDFNSEILTHLEEELLDEVTEAIGIKQSAKALTELDADEAGQIVEELDEEEQIQILQALPEEYRASMQEFLNYPEDSVGRVMRKKFVAVPEYWNVGQVIDYLRSFEDLPEDFHDVYVVDADYKPLKNVITSRILRNKRAASIADIATECKQVLHPETDQEKAAYVFRQYGMASAPVVDATGRMIGVVDVEDMIEVIEEEAEEDFMLLGGVREKDSYFAVLKTVRKRFPWLGINMLSAFISSFIVSHYSDSIIKAVTLAALMPIVAAVSGNAAMQTLTVAISAIAGKSVSGRSSVKVVFKEIFVGMMNGALIAIIAGAISYLIHGDLLLSMIFSISIVLCFVCAGLLGSVIPYTLNALKVDPAIASSAFVAACTDIISFMVFLGLATIYVIQ
jgi:magnesium transporter